MWVWPQEVLHQAGQAQPVTFAAWSRRLHRLPGPPEIWAASELLGRQSAALAFATCHHAKVQPSATCSVHLEQVVGSLHGGSFLFSSSPLAGCVHVCVVGPWVPESQELGGCGWMGMEPRLPALAT